MKLASYYENNLKIVFNQYRPDQLERQEITDFMQKWFSVKLDHIYLIVFFIFKEYTSYTYIKGTYRNAQLMNIPCIQL